MIYVSVPREAIYALISIDWLSYASFPYLQAIDRREEHH